MSEYEWLSKRTRALSPIMYGFDNEEYKGGYITHSYKDRDLFYWAPVHEPKVRGQTRLFVSELMYYDLTTFQLIDLRYGLREKIREDITGKRCSSCNLENYEGKYLELACGCEYHVECYAKRVVQNIVMDGGLNYCYECMKTVTYKDIQ